MILRERWTESKARFGWLRRGRLPFEIRAPLRGFVLA